MTRVMADVPNTDPVVDPHRINRLFDDLDAAEAALAAARVAVDAEIVALYTRHRHAPSHQKGAITKSIGHLERRERRRVE